MSEGISTKDRNSEKTEKRKAREDKFNSCKCQEQPGTGQKGEGDDCVEKWKEEKASAKQTLDRLNPIVQKESEILKYAMEWEEKLKKYFDNIEKTSELADKVYRELGVFIAQTKNVCTNAGLTIDALEIFFCEVKRIFEGPLQGTKEEKDCQKETQEQPLRITWLIQVLDEVNACLKCITDPGLVKDEGILKALEEYDSLLRELEELQKQVLEKIIEALKYANILFFSVCSAHDNTGEGDEEKDKTSKSAREEFLNDALANELEGLWNLFGGEVKGGEQSSKGEKESDCDDNKPSSTEGQLGCENLPGGVLTPKPVFPLSADEYFEDTKGQYDAAKRNKNCKKEALDRAKKARESAQSCYDSLVAAIETAEKAKSGK